MNPYLLARALHIAGAGFFFLSMGVEWMALRSLRRASTDAALDSGVSDFRLARKLDGLGALFSLAGGLYLATTVWQWHGGWLHTGVTLFFIVWGITGMVSGRGVRRLAAATGDQRAAMQRSPRLFIALASRFGLLLATLAIMVLKPGPALQGALVLVSQVGAAVTWLSARRSGSSTASSP
ncbi:MAG: hypothetical protein DI536_19550 [Archangium gephyra]|uniref:DUF2269 family protein n=1 Tax=Archangium gephyra TaxID=48 RepID=A0A2W5V3Z7_9BACT|nr:MAG: hypothetical protein DI536_19550 [Archangium gephyra]